MSFFFSLSFLFLSRRVSQAGRQPQVFSDATPRRAPAPGGCRQTSPPGAVVEESEIGAADDKFGSVIIETASERASVVSSPQKPASVKIPFSQIIIPPKEEAAERH